MDPLDVFPPELVEEIWTRLIPRDLLSARAVSKRWCSSIIQCSDAWVTEHSQDWDEFLEFRKTLSRWRSGRTSTHEYERVKAFAYTESTFYLLFDDGRLAMYNPDFPRRPIRLFEQKAKELHKGDRCLFVGINEELDRDTVVTDLALNIIGVMRGTYIVSASSQGHAYIQDGILFVEFGGIKIESPTLCGEFSFFKTCAVQLFGLTNKTVNFVSVDRQDFRVLEEFQCSPRWIPHITVEPGPGDIYCLAVQQRDFGHIIVYDRDTVLVKRILPSGKIGACFIDKHFVVTAKDERVVSVFRLPKLSYCCTFVADHYQKLIVDEVSLFKGCLFVTEKFNEKSSLYCVKKYLFSKFTCLPPQEIKNYVPGWVRQGMLSSKHLLILPTYILIKEDANFGNSGIFRFVRLEL